MNVQVRKGNRWVNGHGACGLDGQFHQVKKGCTRVLQPGQWRLRPEPKPKRQETPEVFVVNPEAASEADQRIIDHEGALICLRELRTKGMTKEQISKHYSFTPEEFAAEAEDFENTVLTADDY